MAKFRTEKDQFILERCRGKTVLDVGCVNHTLEAALRDDWRHQQIKNVAKQVVGLDYEVEVVKELQKRGFDIVAADAQNFDIRDRYPGGFDIVLASEVIEHLVNPGGFLECARKHLATGGEVLLTTPHAYGIAFFLEVLVWGEEHINDDHTMTFSRKNLRHLLKKCGLQEKEFYWLIQDSTSLHPEIGSRIAAKLLFYFQTIAATLTRTAYSKEMIIIALPQK